MRSDRASAADSIVRVVVDGNLSSGVVLSDRRVLTCAHVVGTHDEVQVRGRIETQDGDLVFVEAPAAVVRVNKRSDLALLEVPTDVTFEVPPMELAKEEPDLYEPVMVAACPTGLFGIVVDGLLQAKNDSADEEVYAGDYVVSGLFVHGSSGGAVVDAHGCLVGIVTSSEKDEEAFVHALGLATPLPAIRRFLRRSKERKRHLKSLPPDKALEDVPPCHEFEEPPENHKTLSCLRCGREENDPIHD